MSIIYRNAHLTISQAKDIGKKRLIWQISLDGKVVDSAVTLATAINKSVKLLSRQTRTV